MKENHFVWLIWWKLQGKENEKNNKALNGKTIFEKDLMSPYGRDKSFLQPFVTWSALNKVTVLLRRGN